MEIFAGPVLKWSKIFLHFRLSLEVIGKSSEAIGNLWRSSEHFQNLWQSSEAVGKSSEIPILWRQKILRILLKKVGRYAKYSRATRVSILIRDERPLQGVYNNYILTTFQLNSVLHLEPMHFEFQSYGSA